MKNILKVTILFCFLIIFSSAFCFADNNYFAELPALTSPSNYDMVNNGFKAYTYSTGNGAYLASNNSGLFIFYYNNVIYLASDTQSYLYYYYFNGTGNNNSASYSNFNSSLSYEQNYHLYYKSTGILLSGFYNLALSNTTDLDNTLSLIRDYIDNPPSVYNKNANVDEFIANTLISMGVKFDTPAYALSYASEAWDWCIDEDNLESAHPFDEWNIDSFVSYCNAQSNNYLNWFNGYKLHEDVTKALGEYIRQNIRSLTGLPAGITSLQGAYLPIYHYGSGFQSGVSSPSAQTFYPAQTIIYFNGEYVNETDDISTSQFLYSPADVRRFLGYPATGSVVIPSDPAAGKGTITDDPNNPDQKNIEINFPSLDWLADAINSILDFLRNALTTLADLLTQLLDAILGLFSDAFASLADFGQGIIEFLQSVFAGLSTLLNGYVPSDLAVIIACFIALNFGIGLITFILKGH